MDSERLRLLARALADHHDDEQCMACLDQLDAYVAAQIAALPYAVLYPAVAAHLDRCVTCAEDYARVYDARISEATATVPQTNRAPDLRFLLPANAQPKGRLAPTQIRAQIRAEQLRTAVRQRIEQTVERLRLVFDEALFDLSSTQQRGVLAYRDQGEQPVMELTVEHPGEAVTQLDVRAYAQPDASRRTVRCIVAVRDREWPDLADIPVRLMWAGQERVALSDAWGEAVFEDVPADVLHSMTIEIDASDL